MTYALREALAIVLEDGLASRITRHEQMHKRLRAGLEAMGLSYIPKHSLHSLNCVGIPAGADDAAVRGRLLKEYGIEIGSGLGVMAGKAWRIGLMGHGATIRNVDLVLTALKQTLNLPQVMTPALQRLAKLLPPERWLTRPEQLAAYESDALTAFQSRPLAVAVPETTDEVVALVRGCHELKVPFVARGSGTSLSGGSLPVKDGIVITLNRLTRILRLDPDQRVAVVQSGVVNTQVTLAAAPHGLHYAPDPSSQTICTIGGNLAFNSGGAHCLKYGMTANHILGIKAVLATGEVVEWGGSSREFVGPDWCGLFTGNEGLFGIALEVTLQLLPRAECYHTVLAGYRTLEQAGDAVTAVVASGLLPGAMEIMDALALEAAVAAVHADYPPGCEAVLIVELEGPREVVEADRGRLDQIIAGSNPVEMRPARDAAERMAIWKGRKSAFSAVGRLSPDFIVQDGVVPRRRLGEALRRIGEMAKESGIRVANVFHAGDGNLHPLILFDGREAGALERAEVLASRVLKMCVEMGGSLTGEHGIGMEKRDHLSDMFSADEIDCMKRLRAAYDPLGIANPGKMFPGKEAPALQQSGLHPLEKAGVISRE